ncbi:hypothetical protein C484_13301 [Natrialba taiwanensis DSM 12281]|uniref:Uncharacterized protein n=1 Tax=Natrialba taiwanensis DSM 12281 TaxID=1230458 RepID=L9ZUI9_9EURY|nr:hypothetical protein C484_13301 [Natrialba taiwanensis DSM 12281]
MCRVVASNHCGNRSHSVSITGFAIRRVPSNRARDGMPRRHEHTHTRFGFDFDKVEKRALPSLTAAATAGRATRRIHD